MERYDLNRLKIHTDNRNNILAEREGQIENLNQAVAESHYQLIDYIILKVCELQHHTGLFHATEKVTACN